MHIITSNFKDNTAGSSVEFVGGGAIWSNVSTLVVSNCTFYNNQVASRGSGSGGSLYIDD